MIRSFFSFKRLYAIIWKEFIQMMRDRMTFAMLIGLPLVQLTLFGYAINANPRHLPTAIVTGDYSVFTRSFIEGMKNTKYFDVVDQVKDTAQADQLLIEGKVIFIVNIPPNFTRDLIEGLRPQILVTGDGADPTATGRAMSAIQVLATQVFNPLFEGQLHRLIAPPNAMDLVEHVQYNPDSVTRYSIVPALLGVILTMTMVIITSLAVTREDERGTIETLLATPARSTEVMLGKLIPYILVGYAQMVIIIVLSMFLFRIPFEGSPLVLLIISMPFVIANLSVGLMFSSICRNQLQAMQMAFFFFLPSILLSGFMFPFYGMPIWAQYIGDVLPLTHYVSIVRGIMLKGATFAQVWPNIWPISVFAVVVLFIGIKMYRQTID